MTLDDCFAFNDLFLSVLFIESKLFQACTIQQATDAVKECQKDCEQEQRWEDPLVEAFSEELDLDQRSHHFKEGALSHMTQFQEVVGHSDRKSHQKHA